MVRPIEILPFRIQLQPASLRESSFPIPRLSVGCFPSHLSQVVDPELPAEFTPATDAAHRDPRIAEALRLWPSRCDVSLPGCSGLQAVQALMLFLKKYPTPQTLQQLKNCQRKTLNPKTSCIPLSTSLSQARFYEPVACRVRLQRSCCGCCPEQGANFGPKHQTPKPFTIKPQP